MVSPPDDFNAAEEIDPSELLQKVHVGDYVALKILQYHEELPQIGKVKEISPATVTIDWLVGSYSGIFSFWKEKGRVICETFPLRGIMTYIKLTQSMRLRKEDIVTLKKLYSTAEFV